ncbi:hypothetical protein SOVF_162400 [Spinacia oleracea]|nr:hypothetical protein SOVF_162400 [Spinacia oleracea]
MFPSSYPERHLKIEPGDGQTVAETTGSPATFREQRKLRPASSEPAAARVWREEVFLLGIRKK